MEKKGLLNRREIARMVEAYSDMLLRLALKVLDDKIFIFACFHFQSPGRLEQVARGAQEFITAFRLISCMAHCRHSGGGIPANRLPCLGRPDVMRLAACC